MNYKDFTLGDWIGHISGAIEDESELDGNEMRDLVEFLSRFPKWVLVSERLPENFQRVLVTIVNYNGDKVVRVAEYFGKQRIFQIKENHDIWKVGEKGLLAWQPLPEPYNESEDKE